MYDRLAALESLQILQNHNSGAVGENIPGIIRSQKLSHTPVTPRIMAMP